MYSKRSLAAGIEIEGSPYMLSTDIITEQTAEEGQKAGQGDGVINRHDAEETRNMAGTLAAAVDL